MKIMTIEKTLIFHYCLFMCSMGKHAWPAESIFSIPTLLMGALLATPNYTMKHGFFLLLICCLLCYIYLYHEAMPPYNSTYNYVSNNLLNRI